MTYKTNLYVLPAEIKKEGQDKLRFLKQQGLPIRDKLGYLSWDVRYRVSAIKDDETGDTVYQWQLKYRM